jgi:iron complex outermembrane receptor protein
MTELSREERVQRSLSFLSTITLSMAVPACVLWAQTAQSGALSGRVLDPSSATVAAATVKLYGRNNAAAQTTQTGAGGEYRFERLAPGDYLLEARTDGLDQASPVSVHIQAGAEVKQDLMLNVKGLATRVLVTASSTPQSTVEAGKAMDVVDRGELERREVNTLTEALREVPALRVQQLGGPGEFTRIQTRGLRAQDTIVLVDGMRLRDAASPQGDSTAYLGDLLVTGSDRIEVLRGSGSSLYGTNAIGSVVNLVTDQGGGKTHGEFNVEGGGLGYGYAGFKLGGGVQQDQLQYSLAAAHLHVDGGVDGIELAHNTSEQGDLTWRPDARTALTARVLAFESRTNVNVSPTAAPDANLPSSGVIPAIALPASQIARGDANQPFAWGNATFAPNFYDPDSLARANFTSTLLAAQRSWTPRITTRIAFQDLRGDRNNTNVPSGQGYQPIYATTDYYRGVTDTFNARLDAALDRHNLVAVGYEYERENFTNRSLDSNPDASQRTDALTTAAQSSHAVFAQEQLRLLDDRLQFSFSGRVTHYDLDAPRFAGGTALYANAPLSSPRDSYTGDGAVSYFLRSSQTKLRAHVGNGYRSPTLYERFGSYFYGGSFYALGDPQLKPDRTIALDFGFDQYFANQRAKLSVSYFYTRLQNVVAYGDTPLNDPYGRWGGYINSTDGLARGVEASGEARPWRTMMLRASYVYTNAIENKAVLTNGFLQAIRIFPHQGSLVATQQIGRRAQVTASLFAAADYISGVFYVYSAGGNRPYLFPGPHRLDLAASYTVPLSDRRALRFYAKLDNALNQTYYEDGFRTPRAWGSAGMKFLF